MFRGLYEFFEEFQDSSKGFRGLQGAKQTLGEVYLQGLRELFWGVLKCFSEFKGQHKLFFPLLLLLFFFFFASTVTKPGSQLSVLWELQHLLTENFLCH